MENANSTEFVPDCKYRSWHSLLNGDEEVTLKSALRRATSAAPCASRSSASWTTSLVRQLYGEPTITERHRHRYEVNNMLLKPIECGPAC
jgi:CTP synthase